MARPSVRAGRKGGRLLGRGASDDKGQVAAAYLWEELAATELGSGAEPRP